MSKLKAYFRFIQKSLTILSFIFLFSCAQVIEGLQTKSLRNNKLVVYGISVGDQVVKLENDTFRKNDVLSAQRTKGSIEMEIGPCNRYVLHNTYPSDELKYFVFDAETNSNTQLNSAPLSSISIAKFSSNGQFIAYLEHLEGDESYNAKVSSVVISSLANHKKVYFPAPEVKTTAQKSFRHSGFFWMQDSSNLLAYYLYWENGKNKIHYYKIDIEKQNHQEISGYYDVASDQLFFKANGKTLNYFSNRNDSSANIAFMLISNDGQYSISSDGRKNFTVYLHPSEQSKVVLDTFSVKGKQQLKVSGWLIDGESFFYIIDGSYYVYNIKERRSELFLLGKVKDIKYFYWNEKNAITCK